MMSNILRTEKFKKRGDMMEKRNKKLEKLQNKAWLIDGEVITLQKELAETTKEYKYKEATVETVEIEGLVFPKRLLF